MTHKTITAWLRSLSTLTLTLALGACGAESDACKQAAAKIQTCQRTMDCSVFTDATELLMPGEERMHQRSLRHRIAVQSVLRGLPAWRRAGANREVLNMNAPALHAAGPIPTRRNVMRIATLRPRSSGHLE